MHANVLLGKNKVRKRSNPRLFNLDLHISVIADLKKEFTNQGIDLTHWSISQHNFVSRRIFVDPDPVHIVNAGSWKKLDDNMIDEFQDRYGQFLRSFDGFVVTYPPAFSELFRGLGKPALVMAATRYEAPYTGDLRQWERLDEYIRSEVNSGNMLLATNNKADQDYCKYFLGVQPHYVPSLCDYIPSRWTDTSGIKVLDSFKGDFLERTLEYAGETWQTSSKVFKRGYSWKDFASIREIFVVPYNISTMKLFEAATAGIPISVPSRKLLKELTKDKDTGSLSQLTWYQVLGIQPPDGLDNPNNSNRQHFLDWWLDRADFYNKDLMPNVRTVDSIEDLIENTHPVLMRNKAEWHRSVKQRNDSLEMQRRNLVKSFVQMI